MSAADAPIFDAVVRIDRLPPAGRTVKVDADAAACAAIALRMGITSVERFAAELTVTPLRGGLRALGRVSARLEQPSVVSFEPVWQDVDEAVDRVFLPAPRSAQPPTPGTEVYVDIDDDDFPDHIDGPEVDLSALLLETLALAIDPYPRREGESLTGLGLDLEEEKAGPFAGLARLKRNPGEPE